jgi:hypothetical protein
MEPFRLRISDSILITDGKIHERILDKLIFEAWMTEGIYAEDRIIFTRKYRVDNKLRKEETSAMYKELWDCYKNLLGKNSFDPHYKKIPVNLMKKVLIYQYKNRNHENKNPDYISLREFLKFNKKLESA